MFHYEYLRESMPAGAPRPRGHLRVLAESPEAVPRIARQIDDMFRNSPEQTRPKPSAPSS